MINWFPTSACVYERAGENYLLVGSVEGVGFGTNMYKWKVILYVKTLQNEACSLQWKGSRYHQLFETESRHETFNDALNNATAFIENMKRFYEELQSKQTDANGGLSVVDDSTGYLSLVDKIKARLS